MVTVVAVLCNYVITYQDACIGDHRLPMLPLKVAVHAMTGNDGLVVSL